MPVTGSPHVNPVAYATVIEQGRLFFSMAYAAWDSLSRLAVLANRLDAGDRVRALARHPVAHALVKGAINRAKTAARLGGYGPVVTALELAVGNNPIDVNPTPSNKPVASNHELPTGVISRTKEIIEKPNIIQGNYAGDDYEDKRVYNYYQTSHVVEQPRPRMARRFFSGRRRYRRRRATYRRRRYGSYGSNYNKNVSIYNSQRRLNYRRIMGGARKAIDDNLTFQSGTVISGGWTWVPIPNIIQGTAISQRIANAIVLKKIQLEGFLQLAGDATADASNIPEQWVKIIILQDRQHNMVSGLTTADVFADTAGGQINDFSTYRNLYTAKRFKIVKEQIYHLKCNTTTATANVWNTQAAQLPFSLHVPVNIRIDYQGTSGLDTNMSENAIYIGYIVNSTSNHQDTTFQQGRMRCRYVDLNR